MSTAVFTVFGPNVAGILLRAGRDHAGRHQQRESGVPAPAQVYTYVETMPYIG